MRKRNYNLPLLGLQLALMLAVLICVQSNTQAQFTPDTSLHYRNAIKLNLTPMALINIKNVNLNYERTLQNQQSFSVNLGINQLNNFLNFDSLNIQQLESIRRTGYTIAADYRFYGKQRNKYPAPDGLFWGIYAHRIWFKNLTEVRFDQVNSSSLIENRIGVNSLGVELGYQLTFSKHWTIDMVLIGPSYSRYSFSSAIDGEIDPSDYKEYLQELAENLPLLAAIFDRHMEKQEFDANGKINFGYFGFRYLLQVGYRF